MAETPEDLIKRLLAAKEERRREMAALPYPEKVKRVVEMQKRVAPILRARGIEVRIWDLEQASDPNLPLDIREQAKPDNGER